MYADEAALSEIFSQLWSRNSLVNNTRRDRHSLTRCGTCAISKGPHVRLKTCSKCQEILYCSSECQRAHWNIHKIECMHLRRTFSFLADMDDKIRREREASGAPPPAVTWQRDIRDHLKAFDTHFRPVILIAAVNAFRVGRNPIPQGWKEKVLMLKLRHLSAESQSIHSSSRSQQEEEEPLPGRNRAERRQAARDSRRRLSVRNTAESERQSRDDQEQMNSTPHSWSHIQVESYLIVGEDEVQRLLVDEFPVWKARRSEAQRSCEGRGVGEERIHLTVGLQVFQEGSMRSLFNWGFIDVGAPSEVQWVDEGMQDRGHLWFIWLHNKVEVASGRPVLKPIQDRRVSVNR